ncbi:MAG: hypothetical protein AABW91_02910 [Nanoarchaeota archaeon]
MTELKNIVGACCVCHSIRTNNEKNIWESSDEEAYKIANSEALGDWIALSHGYCPPCGEAVFAEIKKVKDKRRERQTYELREKIDERNHAE